MPRQHSRPRHLRERQSRGTGGATTQLVSFVQAGNLAVQGLAHRRQTNPAVPMSMPQDQSEQLARRRAQQLTSSERSDTSSNRMPSSALTGGSERHQTSPPPPGLQSTGEPLGQSVRDYFEPRFGRDLSSVRVHNDRASDAYAQKVNARAFSYGSHVGFARGQYDSHSATGRALLAHELAHVCDGTRDNNRLYRENWDIDDSNRVIERQFLVQLNFENTWGDWARDTGWTNARKTAFRSDFKSSIENTFNNSSTRIYPAESQADVLPRANVDQGYQPTVDIDLVPDGQISWGEDWEVDVSSNPTGDFRTSSSSTRYGTLDEADNTAVGKAGAPARVTQVPTVHEFGHFIGLEHPGVGLGHWYSPRELSPGANEYTHTGTDIEGRTVHGPTDLMGTGMELRPFYFDAWARALDEHVAELQRAAQRAQAAQDWRRFKRALGGDPAATQWFMRGLSGAY